MTAFVREPARTSSALALLAGMAAVALVADAEIQRRILSVAVVGVVGFAIAGALWRGGLSVVGVAGAVAGSGIAVVALGLAATRPALFIHRFELLPGVVGLWVLTAGLVPVRIGWERSLVDAGTGLLFVTVLTGGVVQSTSPGALLVAGVLTILSWDAAENAVSLGRQLGDDAPTVRAELVHGVSSVAVAAVALALVAIVRRFGVDGLPFAGLAALLVASVALTLVYQE